MFHEQHLSWEAFATLLTGFLAVVGAIFIGLKQTKIQFAQQRLAETQVRISLFERRSNCVNRMRVIEQIWNENSRLEHEEWLEFRDLFHDAELIYSKPLSQEIEETLGSLFWSKHWLRRSHDYHEQGKAELANQKLDDYFKHDERVFKLMPSLLKKMKDETRLVDWE